MKNIDSDLKENINSYESLSVKGSIHKGLNINISGDLTVHGNIYGSKINVEGNLFVNGNIDIIENFSFLDIKGNINADMLIKAQVKSLASVEIKKDIISSMIKAKESIIAGGSIHKGEILAGYSITAGSIGDKSNAKTKIGAGTDFKLCSILNEMDVEIEEVNKKSEKLKKAILNLENKERNLYSGLPYKEKQLLSVSHNSLEKLDKQIFKLKERREKIRRKLHKTIESFIEVKERIYPGTYLSIQNRYIEACKEYPAGKYTIREGKICRYA